MSTLLMETQPIRMHPWPDGKHSRISSALKQLWLCWPEDWRAMDHHILNLRTYRRNESHQSDYHWRWWCFQWVAAGDNFSGAGGASGSTGIKWFNIADITNFAVVIGAGGTEATKGGNSTFSGWLPQAETIYCFNCICIRRRWCCSGGM